MTILRPDALRAEALFCLAAAALCVMAPASVGAAVGDQIDKLTADDATADDWFGVGVAAGGGRSLVGAYREDARGIDSGSAYLFDSLTGAQQDKLVPSDGTSGDRFGTSVAINEEHAVIGAARDGAGSAYVFDPVTGDQLWKLTPNDGASGDEFGFSAAVDEGLALVGARYASPRGLRSGAAYLFDADTGRQLHKLVPSDGATSDEFGIAVAIDEGRAIVGSYLDNAVTTQSGSAYVFDAATGGQLRKLIPDDGGFADFFGFSVAVEGDVALVGAILDSPMGNHSGSAYLFDITTGQQLDKLLPADGAADDMFGWSVALENGVAVVGALGDNNGRGAAYLFDVATGAQIDKLTASDGAGGDSFGNSVGLADGVAVVGALQDGANVGAAYTFLAAEPPVVGDYDGDGAVRFSDYLTWEQQYGASSAPSADGNGDGVVDASDYTIWRDAWEASAVAVPEPSSLCLAAFAAVIRFRRRYAATCPATAGCGQLRQLIPNDGVVRVLTESFTIPEPSALPLAIAAIGIVAGRRRTG